MQILCKKRAIMNYTTKKIYKPSGTEVVLWKAVVMQAITDATSNSAQKRKISTKQKAIDWLTKENEDFKYVCEMAGFNANIVKDAIMDIVMPKEQLPG